MEIALYRPEIPQNTGNIGRLSICTNVPMHIVGKPGFSLDESAVKRAGLDYWHKVKLQTHDSWEAFMERLRQTHPEPHKKILAFTRFSGNLFTDHQYSGDEVLLFGTETSGLPEYVTEELEKNHPQGILRIPVVEDCRSLNLSNSVAIVVYEALRQAGYPGLVRKL